MMSTRTRLVALAAAWAIYVQVSDPNRVEAIDRLDPFGR
jgi:hypothetical protein